MIIADYRDGALLNIREAPCAGVAQRCVSCCGLVLSNKEQHLCKCDAIKTDDGCSCEGPHCDPAPGCTRVVLAAWPAAGCAGPWGYDEATGLAVPHAENTRLLREAELDRLLADRERITRRLAAFEAAGKDATDSVAALKAIEQKIAEALNG